MKESRLYTVAFTVLLSAACASVLTFANTRWHKRIAANEEFNKIRAIVEVLGLAAGEGARADILRAYDEAVSPKMRGAMLVYEARRGKDLLGYALELNGWGRYGPIRGVLGVAPASDRILGMRIYEQNETPGLGARIASAEWLSQFRDRPLPAGGDAAFTISTTRAGAHVIQGITGASKTMHALGKMINTVLTQFMSGGMTLVELDFGIGPDAVTRATPGYPKSLPKPPHMREEVQRPPFMVRPGVANLALGRPVTSSMPDEPIIGELSQITDGNKKSGEFDYVELDLGPQWVQIDLGAVRRVCAVTVWHYYKNPIVYNDVIVQVADDAEFTRGVRTLFNNDHDDTSGLGVGTNTAFYSRWWGEVVDTRGPAKDGLATRYVRVYTNGGAGGEDTRFVEIAVYGGDAEA